MSHASYDIFCIRKTETGYLLVEQLPGQVAAPDAYVPAEEANLLATPEALAHLYDNYGPVIGVIREEYGSAHLMDTTFDSKFYFR